MVLSDDRRCDKKDDVPHGDVALWMASTRNMHVGPECSEGRVVVRASLGRTRPVSTRPQLAQLAQRTTAMPRTDLRSVDSSIETSSVRAASKMEDDGD